MNLALLYTIFERKGKTISGRELYRFHMLQ